MRIRRGFTLIESSMSLRLSRTPDSFAFAGDPGGARGSEAGPVHQQPQLGLAIHNYITSIVPPLNVFPQTL